MIGPPQRPLLFLDVDGPLIPFGGTREQFPDRYPAYRTRPGAAPAWTNPLPATNPPPTTNPLLARIDPALGPRLRALPCDLVWATTWMAEANEVIAPLLGLPELPVVSWPEPSDEDVRRGIHWKTRTLVHWAAGRAFAWLDDEISATDRSWVKAHHPGRALLQRVDHRRGATEADFAVLDEWLRADSR